MAAKMAAGTYNFVTNSARRLILVSRHMFFGSSYSMLPLVHGKTSPLQRNPRWLPIWPPKHKSPYISTTTSPTMLILVSKHRFLGSSYPFWPTVVFWNDPVMQKSKMATNRHFEIYSNLSLLAPNALRRQMRCNFPQMLTSDFHYEH